MRRERETWGIALLLALLLSLSFSFYTLLHISPFSSHPSLFFRVTSAMAEEQKG